MKLKAVATSTLPQSLINAMNSSDMADDFWAVLREHLHVPREELGPATHYVQETDLIVPPSNGVLGVEVTVSKVSLSDRRSAQDFKNALNAIQAHYADLIRTYVHRSSRQVQLFCVLVLDGPIKFTGEEPTSLIELPPIMVAGLG